MECSSINHKYFMETKDSSNNERSLMKKKSPKLKTDQVFHSNIKYIHLNCYNNVILDLYTFISSQENETATSDSYY